VFLLLTFFTISSIFCRELIKRPICGLNEAIMKIVKSLKSLKARDKNCRIVRRKGRVLVINKMNKRFKAKQA